MYVASTQCRVLVAYLWELQAG